ncbi:MAG TPA: aspartate/glutamate racemase family protein [Beijerinckiaceae bacterium]|jgi:Asp/Glu/hydantoin racemase|nr:aspartate/glutamate racemase family protein [Beijerinckiaceae bacterium]
MRILFLNPVPNPGGRHDVGYDVAKIEAELNALASPGTKVEIGFPDDYAGSKINHILGQQSNMNGLHHILQAPSLIGKIVWAAENGYDAVVQSNTFEPGVEGGRMAVKIPVIGLLRTSLHTATMLADKVGIIVPLDSHVPYVERLVRTYGMTNFVSGVRAIGVYGPRLDQRKAEITELTVKLIKDLISGGAQIVLPLGGLLIPYVVDPKDLQRETGAPVLNTKAIGIAIAEFCVRMGLSQSPLTYNPAALKHGNFMESAFA